MTTIPLSSLPAGGVLVASASSSLREQVMHRFHERRWPVQEAMGGADALIKLETGNWQLLYLDRRLPDLDAEELIQIIQRRFPGIEVVLVDSDSAPIPAVAKPEISQPRVNDTAAAAHAKTVVEPLPGMIGETEEMRRVYHMARIVAPHLTTVLIVGATGTGKELVARAVHKLSPRVGHPFVVVNCAAIPENLLESELFGYVRGAFTGAAHMNPGRIAAAQGGTLFLDEIGELPLSLQAKLLRFLDQKEIQRLGSLEVMRADVRVIAATNADLARAVPAGQFRSDLYYRLAAFPLELPSLAERTDDIPRLAEHFLHSLAVSGRNVAMKLSAEALHTLQSRTWEGNVRELQQLMERAVILAQAEAEMQTGPDKKIAMENGPTIRPEHLYFPHSLQKKSGPALENFAHAS